MQRKTMMRAIEMSVKGYLTVASLLLGFWSCKPDYGNLLTSPSDLPPLIFAILNTAADSQYVVLRNPTPPAGPYKDFLEREYQLFRQARVAVRGPSGDFVFNDRYEIASPFHEDFEHDFVFVSAQRVRPGETYELRADIPGKGIFTAVVTTPEDFQISTPSEMDTIDVSSLCLCNGRVQKALPAIASVCAGP